MVVWQRPTRPGVWEDFGDLELFGRLKGSAHDFHIEVRGCQLSCGRSYEVELRGPNGLLDLRAIRTPPDFERLWAELRRTFPATALPGLAVSSAGHGCEDQEADGGGGFQTVAPRRTRAALPLPPSGSCSANSAPLFASSELQRALNEVCRDSLMFHSRPLQELLGLPASSTMASAPGARQVPGLTMIAECHQPLLLEIVDYLADSARDFVSFGGLTSRTVVMQVEFAVRNVWRDLYARRWSAFAECLNFQGVQDWRLAYKETLYGRCECTLEVFDREKKLGFAMAAMAARVQYQMGADIYVAKYLSASEVRPESIPHRESHRLRFCPRSARSFLLPRVGCGPSGFDASSPIDAVAANAGSIRKAPLPPYPYRVLEGGIDGLRVGRGVELQWKMQYGSPFGWWFGTLEELRPDPNGTTAVAVLTFKHFPASSRWYRLEVRFGDAEMRPCFFGGYTGGIRSVSKDEHHHWMRFFPREPIVF